MRNRPKARRNGVDDDLEDKRKVSSSGVSKIYQPDAILIAQCAKLRRRFSAMNRSFTDPAKAGSFLVELETTINSVAAMPSESTDGMKAKVDVIEHYIDAVGTIDNIIMPVVGSIFHDTAKLPLGIPLEWLGDFFIRSSRNISPVVIVPQA